MEKLTRWGLIALVPLLSFCGDDDGTTGMTDMDPPDMVMVDQGPDDMGPDDMGPDDMGPDDMGPDDMGPDDMGPDDMPPTLVSIAAAPADVTLNVGGTQAITVTGTFSDDSTMELTEGVTFASTDDAVATVDAAGLVTAEGAGAATITATSGDLMATTEVAVLLADFVVFDDAFAPGVSLADFGGAANAVSVTATMPFAGTSALSVPVPAEGFTGGTYLIDTPVDLSGYDALRFAVRSSVADRRMNVAGFGNDNATNYFNSEVQIPGGPGVPATTTWTEFTIPIPNPARADAFVGLFHFAEGAEDGAYELFIDEIRYVDLPDGTVTNVRPNIANEVGDAARDLEVGMFADVNGESAVFEVAGADILVAPAGIGFFDVMSADTAIAAITAAPENRIEGIAEGNVNITASLGGVMAGGINEINVVAPPPSDAPDVAAPTPTEAAADVISLYSDTYTDVPVDTFRTPWSNTGAFRDEAYVSGNNGRVYEDVVFFGIETVGPNSIDLTGFTHLHVDVWIEGMSATRLGIGIVDFGADNAFGGGDDVRGDVAFFDTSTPPLSPGGSWQSFDIPLSDFVGLTTREHVSQYIFDPLPNATTTMWIDNMYFYTAP